MSTWYQVRNLYCMQGNYRRDGLYDVSAYYILDSNTGLVYINDQIAEYSEGWTKKMATPRSYFNLEGAFV